MSHNSTLLDPCRDAPDVNRTANATSENYCYKSVTDPGFITGFWLDDTGTCYRNCSQICTDPKLLFSYWGTITGCLNWSPLDRVVSVEVSSQVELNRTHLIAIDLINSCMKEYCEFPDPDLGGCNYTNITDPARRAHWMDSAMFAFEETSGACDVVRTVNSDLGGPGVFVSYLVQIILAWGIVIAYLYRSRHFKSNSPLSESGTLPTDSNMTPAVLESGELPHEKDSKNPASSESEKFPKNSKKIASSKSRKASKASNPKLGIIQKVAGEFQESQCYFFLATHTAAFVGISRSDIFKSTNARQATANCDFILVMAEVSSVMNYLGITICSLANVSSKWTQFLSVVSLIFSLVVVGLTNTQEGVCGTKSLIILNPLDSRPAGSRSVSACGGNSPPNVYCGGLSSANLNRRPDVFNRWVEFWGWFGLLISCVIFVLFLIMMFYKGSKGSRKVKWPPYPGWISRKYFNFNNFQRILLFLLLVASVFAVYILATLAKGYIDFEDWGIGQIIALFVWVPVVAHWVRWSIRGGVD